MNKLRSRNRKIYILGFFSLLCLLVLIPAIRFSAQNQHNTRVRAAGNMPQVQRNQIVDGFGNQLILRGAHIQSTLDRFGSYVTPADAQASKHLNSATFDVMANNWNMNTVRLATSDWLWQKNPTGYIQTLQNIVAQANQSGLYVVLSLHEDLASGMPLSQKEPSGWSMPTPLAQTYWQTVASTFKSNPMVMFDIYNEPHVNETGASMDEPGWQFWMNGGTIHYGTNKTYTVIGMQTLVNTIRNIVGANQIIIAPAAENSFQKFESDCPSTNPHCNFLSDPTGNIVYSVHVYFQSNIRTPTDWDNRFGTLGQEVPIFIGEWEFSINSSYTARCDEPSPPSPPNTSMTPDEANTLVQNFLSYMDSHGTNWTTFAFTLNQTILDYNNYTPTSLYNPPWTCGDPHAKAGDGSVIKLYLLNGLQAFTPTPTP